MEIKSISLSDRQIEYVEKERKKLGVTFTEMIKRILDNHIDKELKKDEKNEN